MTLRDRITAWAEGNDITLVFLEPAELYDHAIVGLVYGAGTDPVVLYDERAIRRGLRDELGGDDGDEMFDFQTLHASMGEGTPRFLTRPWEA